MFKTVFPPLGLYTHIFHILSDFYPGWRGLVWKEESSIAPSPSGTDGQDGTGRMVGWTVWWG